MNNLNPYQQYKTQAINTLTPGELLILLYDQMILNINKAIRDIKNKDIVKAHENIIKTENIVAYLMDILDMSYPISKELLMIYDFFNRQLVAANISKDEKILKDLLVFISDMKNTWQQADIKSRHKNIV